MKKKSPISDIRRSRISGSPAALYTQGGSAAGLAHSQVIGEIQGGGNNTCIGAYQEDLEPLSEQCQPSAH